MDESAITGESAPVIRESGGDRSAVTGGTRVLSDWIVVRITSNPGHTFLDRMIALVEGAVRQKTPNEIALNILLAVLTLVFLLVVVTLQPFAVYAGTSPVPVLISLLVCLIPTTIGALISAIGIAGMDRLVQHNVLAMSGRAVEAAGDVDTLLLDKTGTITLGNRQASVRAGAGVTEAASPTPPSSARSPTRPPRAARSSCWRRHTGSARELAAHQAQLMGFSAQTRMSGITWTAGDPQGRGRRDRGRVQERGSALPAELGPGGTDRGKEARRWRSRRTGEPWAWSTSRTS